jgi:hypothetical protein
MQKKRKMSASPKPGSKSAKAGEAPTRKGERKKAPSGPVTEIEEEEEEETEGRLSSARRDADDAPTSRQSIAKSSDEDAEEEDEDLEGQDEDLDEGERGFSSSVREDEDEDDSGRGRR